MVKRGIAVELQVFNNTEWAARDVLGFAYLGRAISKWRQRAVELYAHPSDPSLLVSFGRSFDGSMEVIAVEPRSAWATALEYASRGQVYVSE